MRFWVNMIVISLLAVCVVGYVHSAYAVTYQDAANQVADADQTLRSAFNGTLDAEQHGANVSVLVTRLTDAGSALTEAEEALAVGNYSGAVDRAVACKSLASAVAEDAVVLKSDAVAAAGSWWVTVLLSVVTSLVFVGGVFFVWRWFRQGYLKKIAGSRPEVTG